MEQSSRGSLLNSVMITINVLALLILVTIAWQIHNLNQLQLSLSKSQLVQNQANTAWTITTRYMEKWPAIMKDRELVAKQKLSSDKYWRSFWFLQQEQYYLWKDGMINNNIFQIWMNFRRSEWNRNESLAGVSYRDAYQTVVKTGLLTSDFQEYMKEVFSTTISPTSK